MAVLPKNQIEKDRDQAQQQYNMSSDSALVTPSQTGTLGTSQTVTSPGQTARQSGTGYQNLRDYLKLGVENKPLQEKVAASTEQAKQVGSDISGMGAEFGSGLSVPTLPTTATRPIYDEEGYNTGDTETYSVDPSAKFNKMFSDPTKITPSQIEEFRKYQNAQYTGPQSIASGANYNPTLQNISNLEGIAGATGSSAGIEGLLGDIYKNPTLSTGAKKLDYLSARQTMQPEFKKLRESISPLRSKLAEEVGKSEEAAKQTAGNAATTRAATNTALNAAVQKELDREKVKGVDTWGLDPYGKTARAALEQLGGFFNTAPTGNQNLVKPIPVTTPSVPSSKQEIVNSAYNEWMKDLGNKDKMNAYLNYVNAYGTTIKS